VSRNGKVGREARTVSMVSCDVRRAGSVEGLNIDEDIGIRLIVVTEYYIGGVRDGVVLHPLVHGSLASVAATFSRNTRGAKDWVWT